ncbi:mitochondrial 39-S ribosomal protein L47 MRP-L47 domain-containing protein [Theileria equi strain WA]|uniref:Large ribosomal subunit protein uL29m n=1 Tax=Theileria equi strain WA TaxID=1537102 RepID=L0B271_THEEQ|nr:mitochondrial 39-S ribosomal protein L47 MRP-L47 domain-containing protein [Theileria equi strain WA]AFZ81229.1 mitochondrial 39-S ribosomal protein L47 MRP-L47 domain-containing protein [Theileria equi strain WA]|eukprot:XP_004830895.1 mitochondrial 39-S ribosomal protein L47 MRP-L47 domain-containing protein [Theileria equi strain WA]
MSLCRLFRSQNIGLSIPRRGIDELWKGGYLDPNTPFRVKEKLSVTGYAWPSYLLRLKSFEDLRSLYFACLKEKNLLLGERWAALQHGVKPPKYGRLKKVKLTMKRILGVVTRREIHQQCIRAKEILKAQQEKEKYETRAFQLKELRNELQYKVKRMGTSESLAKVGWINTLSRIDAELEDIELKLQPLRKETLQLRTPDWRFEKKYSDLPGRITWNKDYIPAIRRNLRRPFKFY